MAELMISLTALQVVDVDSIYLVLISRLALTKLVCRFSVLLHTEFCFPIQRVCILKSLHL